MPAFVRGVGGATSNSTGNPLTVVTPARFVGDIVLITTIVSIPNDPSGTTGVEVSADHGAGSIQILGDARNRFRLLAFEVTASDDGLPVTVTRAPGLDTGTDTIFTAKSMVIGGVAGGLAGVTAIAWSGPYTAAGGAVPALASAGTAGVAVMLGLAITPQVGGSAPSGYDILNQETMGSGLGAGFAYYQRNTLNSTPSVPSSFPAMGANGQYAFFGLVFPGTPTVTMPATAPAALLKMGCAESYQAFITHTNPVSMNDDIVAAVAWDSITWGRVLDDVSQASVTISDRYGGVRCCADLGGLVPWTFGLRIERNDQLVWKGPVVNVTRPTGDSGGVPTIQVEAQDAWGRYRRRLATHTTSQQYNNLDAGVVFSAVQSLATYQPAQLNGFVLPWPTVIVGTGITREIVARDFEYAWDIMEDLLRSALDGYIMNGVQYLFQPGVGWMFNDGDGTADQVFKGPTDTTSGELLYGLFTESSYRDRPGWSISGIAQANQAWEPGADTGEEGARRYWTAVDSISISEVGVLDVVDPNPLYRSISDGVVLSDATFQRRADSLIQQRSRPPAIIDGGALSDDAPIDMDNLRPGSIWRMDIYDSCYGQLLQNGRLKRVEVTVSRENDGIKETVSPTVFPVGYTEANLDG